MLTYSLLVVALAQTQSPPSSRWAACGSDDDCVITTQTTCCECCPATPTAMSKQALADQRCELKQCKSCEAVLCKAPPEANSLRAICRGGTCRAEPIAEIKNPSICRRDSDCLVTSFSCCETCCALPAEAMTAAQLEAKRLECGQTMCAMIKCAPENCPKVSVESKRAVCRDNRCALAPALPPPTEKTECRVDADCTVEYRTPPTRECGVCGCCPGTEPVAQPLSMATSPTPKSSPLRPSAPPFGLSAPGAKSTRHAPPPQQMPNCSPCPSPKPASAVCRAGRCTLKD